MTIQALLESTNAELGSFIEGISEVPDFLVDVIDMMCRDCKYATAHAYDCCGGETSCLASYYTRNLPDLRIELAEQVRVSELATMKWEVAGNDRVVGNKRAT